MLWGCANEWSAEEMTAGVKSCCRASWADVMCPHRRSELEISKSAPGPVHGPPKVGHGGRLEPPAWREQTRPSVAVQPLSRTARCLSIPSLTLVCSLGPLDTSHLCALCLIASHSLSVTPCDTTYNLTLKSRVCGRRQILQRSLPLFSQY